jgi:phosphoribosylanthranilate isomerase
MTEIRVKICGITNFIDAQVAVEAGADLLGFIFFPKSPRYIEPDQVKEIAADLRVWLLDNSSNSHQLPKLVGVFVNETGEHVAQILAHTGIDYAQLHGGEPPALLEQLAPRAYKALRPSSSEEALIDAEWYGEFGPADGPQLLIDAYDPHAYGGTGKQADWHTVAGLARRYPRLMLAGGLTPENVTHAVRMARPWGVDVSSGVEREPGQKDHDAVRAFIQRAKEALA